MQTCNTELFIEATPPRSQAEAEQKAFKRYKENPNRPVSLSMSGEAGLKKELAAKEAELQEALAKLAMLEAAGNY